MKHFLLAVLAVLATASTSSAGKGSSGDDALFVKRAQGRCIRQFTVSCPTAGDTVLVTAADAVGAMSVEFTNNDTTNAVAVCPRAAGSGQCNVVGKGKRIPASQSWPVDFAVGNLPWSCVGLSGAVNVGVIIEASGDPNTKTCWAPTPTPLPSLTPTPSPTPVPTPTP